MRDALNRPQEIPGLTSLKRAFGLKLWDVKSNSCSRAARALQTAKSIKKKRDVLTECFVAWREDSGSLIRQYFPQFVELGLAYSTQIARDIADWAEDQTWEVLSGQCGVTRFGNPHPRPRCSKAVVWWLAVAIDGDYAVNQRRYPPYCVPKWLATNPYESDRMVGDLSHQLSGRFFGVLTDEIEAARVRIAIATAPNKTESKPFPASSTVAPQCPFSEDFRSVAFQGSTHLLTPAQGCHAEILWKALLSGHPAVSKERLLSSFEGSSTVRDAWKKSTLWNKLIVSKRKGTYQLNPDLFFL